VGQLITSWPSSVDTQERTRRLLDLFLVSVLLDLRGGSDWCYKSKENGKTYKRSEGLAVASMEMFKSGMFSGDQSQPFRVDAQGLRGLTGDMMARALQISEHNQIEGLEVRTGILVRLADALDNREFFGFDARPGNMLGESPFSFHTYLSNHSPRLPNFPSDDPRLICSHCTTSNSLDCPHGRSVSHLGAFPYHNRKYPSR
jgi:hypothetical protein